MLSDEGFYNKWRKYFRRNNRGGSIHYPDQYDGDQFAMIVVDDMAAEVIISSPSCFAPMTAPPLNST